MSDGGGGDDCDVEKTLWKGSWRAGPTPDDEYGLMIRSVRSVKL